MDTATEVEERGTEKPKKEVWTNLRLSEKKKHVEYILNEMALDLRDPGSGEISRSGATSLVLHCTDTAGETTASFSCHTSHLAAQSSMMRELLSTPDSSLILQDVEADLAGNLLMLLYVGSCKLKQEDFPKLRRLLNSLGLDHISDKLVQIDTVKEEMPECWEPASREKMSEEGRVPPGPPGPPGPLQSSAAWPVLLEARVRGRGRPPGRDLAAVVRAGQKRSKACPVCRAVIAGAGTNWRFPLYSHLSRKHFSNELLKEFGNPEMNCSICGKAGSSMTGPSTRSQYVAHLGAKHRLVERFISVADLENQDTLLDFCPSTSTPAEVGEPGLSYKGNLIKRSSTREAKEKKNWLSDDVWVCKPSRRNLSESSVDANHSISGVSQHQQPVIPEEKGGDSDSEGSDPSWSEESKGCAFAKIKIKNESKSRCPHCKKKPMADYVLQSHMLSKHFKADCKAGLEAVLERSGGVCPLCPDYASQWQPGQLLDWNLLAHFSRKHRITQDLTFNNMERCEENIRKIVKVFFPDEVIEIN